MLTADEVAEAEGRPPPPPPLVLVPVRFRFGDGERAADGSAVPTEYTVMTGEHQPLAAAFEQVTPPPPIATFDHYLLRPAFGGL